MDLGSSERYNNEGRDNLNKSTMLPRPEDNGPIEKGRKNMKLQEIIDLLEAEEHFKPENFEDDIQAVAASDLMSDVLASTGEPKLLLTGLATKQSIRTASILDIRTVVIVRGKTPHPKTVEMAEDNDITLLGTKKSMFLCCALLYNSGLSGTNIDREEFID